RRRCWRGRWPTSWCAWAQRSRPSPAETCERLSRGRRAAADTTTARRDEGPAGRRRALRGGLAEPQLRRAGGPGAPALRGLQALAHLDLGLAAVLVRQAGAADGVPAGLRELQAAVVAVAGVDRPVAARLAGR